MKYILTTITLLLVLTFELSAQQEVYRPSEVTQATYFDVSPPLRDMPVIEPSQRDHSWKDGVVKNKMNMPEHRNAPVPEATPEDYKFAQTTNGTRESELMVSVNGVGNVNGVLPPDTQGDVGPNHYMQMVNLSFAIWDKAGTLLYGPVDNKTLWNGFSGPWSGSNDGDPIVLYDEQADRWIASQFALPNYPNGPFYELIAVSQTPDPTGAWYRYAFTFTNMPDYPKLGVWRDGYYLSVNSFSAGSLNWAGTGVAALERDKMLVGDPTASMIFFTTSSGNDPSAFLPADCDGTPAPEGSPALFGYVRDGSPDRFVLYSLHADWDTPANSTFSQLITLNPQAFSSSISGIAQQGSSTTLQAVSDRLMYRLQYRNFGSYQTMVTNHTVNVSGHAGVRWYEFRNSGSGWSIYQQGTYSPDATSRWMGSIAMNRYGDIGLGYSASSSSVYPSVRFTGRRASDPLGEMTFAEQNIVVGGGAQTSFYQRWGDYSMMSVDPSADTVFWYTQEYYTSTSNQNWKTRVGSFSFGIPLVAIASADIDTICTGESVQLNAQVNGGAGNVTYAWTSFPGSFTSNLPNPVVSPLVSTQYNLTITSGSNTATSSVAITVNPLPTISVSDDITACEGSEVRVVANATENSSLMWTSLGDGTFINPEVSRADYMPGLQDIINGSVSLIAEAISAYGCGSVTDTLELTILAAAVADAGISVETCSNDPIQLSGSASGYASVLWATTGDGTFNDATAMDAVYTPGSADLIAGSLDLIFTAYGNAPCGDVADTISLSIITPAAVDAGIDAVICADNNVQLDATGTDYISVLWETSGDGTFSDASSINSTYQPGSGDINTGQATLTLSATGNGSCPLVADQLELSINKLTMASAGNDTTICKTSSLIVKGMVQFADTYQWSTTGNGTFENPSSLVTAYFPGTQDTVSNSVTLSLSANGQCGEIVAEKTVQFAACLGIETIGKASVKILPNPTSGKFGVEINGMPDNIRFRLTVADTKGNQVFDHEFSSNARVFKTTLDLSSQPKGIYLLKLSSGSEMSTTKIILQ